MGACVGRRTVIKTLVGIVALGVLGVLFVRSAQSTRAEPYEMAGSRLSGWTLAADPMPSRPGTVLTLRPPAELAPDLFRQVFLRAGESLHGPNPAALPLVLEGELDGAAPGTLTSDALLALARDSGLETTPFEPRCMAYRRVSEPGLTRQLYFVRFASPAFDEFRRQLAQRISAGGSATAFDPAALSPVLIIGASDAAFSTWLPLRPLPVDDCLAPIAVR